MTPHQYVYAIHAPDPDRLPTIVEEMRVLGRPQIRVVDCGDYYMAIEGSHRLAACAQLGIAPELVVLDQDDTICDKCHAVESERPRTASGATHDDCGGTWRMVALTRPDLGPPPLDDRRRILVEEALRLLEETRQSFRSKQVAQARELLERVLDDA